MTPIKTDALTGSPLIEVAVKRKEKKPRRKHERKIRKINEASLLDDWGQEDLNGAVERGGGSMQDPGKRKTGLTSNSIAGKTQEEEEERKRKPTGRGGKKKSQGKINGT